MANTTSDALSAAITFSVQKKVLENLRSALVFADRAYAEPGTFQEGSDTLLFVSIPDLSYSTTPLTEGTAPTPRALTLGTVTVATAQYGDAISISDVAKVKSPVEIVNIGSDRITRQSKEVIDQISRDSIALGGTPLIAEVSSTLRSQLDSGDTLDVSWLRKLRTKMRKAKIPQFSDGFYRLMVHPNVAYDLKTEALANPGNFTDVNRYTDAGRQVLLRGEIGSLEGFRIMEVLNAPTFSSSVTVYASLALGDIKGWGVGDLQTFEAFHIRPGGDHTDYVAQQELLAWKVMFGVAVLANAYFYRLESYATDV